MSENSTSGESSRRVSPADPAPWPTGGARFERLAMHYAESYLGKSEVERLVRRGPRPNEPAAVGVPEAVRADSPSLFARLVRSLRGGALSSS